MCKGFGTVVWGDFGGAGGYGIWPLLAAWRECLRLRGVRPQRKSGPWAAFFVVVSTTDYFSASNTCAVISSTLPTPEIFRYFGGATFAPASPLAAQSE